MLHILIGMPDKAALGGANACEPPFVRELRSMKVDADEEVYVYGDDSTHTNIFKRIVRVIHTARRLRRRLRAKSYAMLHLNTAFDVKAVLRDVVCVAAVCSFGTKIFLKLHGSDARLLATRNPLLRSLMRFLLNRVDGIGVLSAEERDNFLRFGVAQRKVFVVKNVVKENLHERDANFRVRLHLAPDVPLLLFAARLIPEKGLIDVVRACVRLHEEGERFVLLCLGDGAARAAAEREAAQAGIGAHVRFFGRLPEAETDAFYSNSTLLVFPTYHQEGLSMTIFNSIAAGLPVITTRLRAAADYLSEPENCLWVEPRDPAMLAAKVSYLLQRPETCAAMRANSLALAKEFTASIVAAEFIEIYERLLQTKQL